LSCPDFKCEHNDRTVDLWKCACCFCVCLSVKKQTPFKGGYYAASYVYLFTIVRGINMCLTNIVDINVHCE